MTGILFVLLSALTAQGLSAQGLGTQGLGTQGMNGKECGNALVLDSRNTRAISISFGDVRTEDDILILPVHMRLTHPAGATRFALESPGDDHLPSIVPYSVFEQPLAHGRDGQLRTAETTLVYEWRIRVDCSQRGSTQDNWMRVPAPQELSGLEDSKQWRLLAQVMCAADGAPQLVRAEAVKTPQPRSD